MWDYDLSKITSSTAGNCYLVLEEYCEAFVGIRLDPESESSEKGPEFIARSCVCG